MVIAGAGPAGLMLAAELALAEVDVAVAERLVNLGEPGDLDIAPWAERVQLIDASYGGEWELPVLGVVSAPSAVLIRPDGYVAWVGEGTDLGLGDALATWFGPPAAA